MEFAECVGWGGDDAWDGDVTGVAVDSHDRVYALRRGDFQVTVLHSDGSVAHRWGCAALSDRPHLISIDGRDKVYIADDGGHRIFVFDTEGRLLETVGCGAPSDTGFDDPRFAGIRDAFDGMAGGPPFNRPTKAVAWHSGELFVTDGYRNCRVHRFSADRRRVHSWGGAGAAAGHFVIPHGLTIDNRGHVLVCDRENDRLQVFSRDGDLIEVLTHVQRPTDVAVDERGNIYVTELPRGPRDITSWRLGPAVHEAPGRVTVWSADGTMVARLGAPAVVFAAPHAVAVDSTGSFYVAEVPESFFAHTGRPYRKHRCLHKFQPVGRTSQ